MIYNALPRSAHLEISDRCQAGCPMCGRTKLLDGTDSSYINNVDLTYEEIYNAFPPEYLEESKFDYVNVCGSFGDPLMNPDAFKILEHFASRGIETALFTNGSLRNEKWWYELGQMFAKGHPKNYAYFAIDGVDQETHEYYRRFTKLDKILKNAKAFMDGGGKAIWNFIVFKHNEHQVKEAQRISQEMGFWKFSAVKTDRFILHDIRDGIDKKGREFSLERPTDEQWLIDAQHSYARTMIEYYKNYEKRLENGDTVESKISCEVAPKGQIFVGADGFVFPCCYTYGFYKRILVPDGELGHGITKVDPVYPWTDEVNIKHTPIGEIVLHDYFIDTADKFNTLPVPCCQKACGIKYVKRKEDVYNTSSLILSSFD